MYYKCPYCGSTYKIGDTKCRSCGGNVSYNHTKDNRIPETDIEKCKEYERTKYPPCPRCGSRFVMLTPIKGIFSSKPGYICKDCNYKWPCGKDIYNR